jgi:hypothetical protein
MNLTGGGFADGGKILMRAGVAGFIERESIGGLGFVVEGWQWHRSLGRHLILSGLVEVPLYHCDRLWRVFLQCLCGESHVC